MQSIDSSSNSSYKSYSSALMDTKYNSSESFTFISNSNVPHRVVFALLFHWILVQWEKASVGCDSFVLCFVKKIMKLLTSYFCIVQRLDYCIADCWRVRICKSFCYFFFFFLFTKCWSLFVEKLIPCGPGKVAVILWNCDVGNVKILKASGRMFYPYRKQRMF